MSKDRKIPLVSVIVLTYNHENFIRSTLDSIICQKTSFDFEILIGDDCSKDGTRKILEDYALHEKRIRLFLNSENLGANLNARQLLHAAKGDYIANCDGDDYWIDEFKLQKQVDFLESHKGIVGCTHKFFVVDEDDNKRKEVLPWVKEKELFYLEDFNGIYMPGQPSTFMRRNFIKEKKIDIDLVYKVDRNIGDRVAMLLYLLVGPFGFIPQYMSVYRKTSSKKSMTSTMYESKVNAWRNDYLITLKLEKIAKEMGKSVSFTEFKNILVNKLIVYGLLSFDFKAFSIAMEIWRNQNYDGDFIFGFVCWICEKIMGEKNK